MLGRKVYGRCEEILNIKAQWCITHYVIEELLTSSAKIKIIVDTYVIYLFKNHCLI